MKVEIHKDAKANIDERKYNNIYVGLELEGVHARGPAVLKKLAEDFGVPCGRSATKQKKEKATTRGGQEIEFSMPVSLYDNPEFVGKNPDGVVVNVYNDGSVPIEVVTRPVSIANLHNKIKPIFDHMLSKKIDLWGNGRAGCHMTLLLASHMYDSTYDKEVVRNFIQLTRLFYEDIVRGLSAGEGNKSRATSYRKINTRDAMRTLHTDKYSGVHVKTKGNGDIWALEVRIPDGTNDFNKLMESAHFYSALLRFSAKISRYGHVKFSQDIFDKNTKFSDEHRDKIITGCKQSAIFKGLLRQLKPFYQLLIDKRRDIKPEEAEKRTQLLELLLGCGSQTEIQKELKFGSVSQVKREYDKICIN
jgi:hypothetical protein